ncbi:hypothetical protein K3495_g17035, partial [Podosphaera aphanis]
MSGSTKEIAHFKSKFGPIAILTTSTFNEWFVDCNSVLAIMGARGMLNGSDIRPPNSGNAQRSWDEKAREVLAVINGSCSRTYKEECISFSDSLDIKGLWDKLTAANPSNNPQFVSQLLREFHLTRFDPKKEKIQDVVNRLNEIKIKLAPTENRLADQSILSQLIHSLPQDD